MAKQPDPTVPPPPPPPPPAEGTDGPPAAGRKLPGGITNGAELVKRLKESGTPDHLLTAARTHLEGVYMATGGVAPAADVVEVLAAALNTAGTDAKGVPLPEHGTVRKARQLVATGTLPTPAGQHGVPIEDILLG